MIEMSDKQEVLEAPMGAILGTMMEMVEEEDMEGAMMVLRFVDDADVGYQFQIECRRVEPEKKGFFNRLLRR